MTLASLIIPTRNRRTELAASLNHLSTLALESCEIVIADNASEPPIHAPAAANGVPVRTVRLTHNAGAAARNAAAEQANGDWLVMLDDDSVPTDCAFLESLSRQPKDTAAVMADIRIADGTREMGGLPEVFVGCGAAVRRDAFLAAGGYDAAFGYYAEEYDLCAKLLLAGDRVGFEPAFGVLHRRTDTNRDFARTLRLLTRNNAWVAQRYAPDDEREEAIRRDLHRYRAIAEDRGVPEAWREGKAQALAALADQPRTPMPVETWDRFTGLAAARRSAQAAAQHGVRRACLHAPGKNRWAVEQALHEAGIETTPPEHAQAAAIGTLSPGPALDAIAALRRQSPGLPIISPWTGHAD